MEYRHLGGSGLVVSEIGLGSWLTLGSSVDRAATREKQVRAHLRLRAEKPTQCRRW